MNNTRNLHLTSYELYIQNSPKLRLRCNVRLLEITPASITLDHWPTKEVNLHDDGSSSADGKFVSSSVNIVS